MNKGIDHSKEISENVKSAIEYLGKIVASDDFDEIGVNLRMCMEFVFNTCELRAHELSSAGKV